MTHPCPRCREETEEKFYCLKCQKALKRITFSPRSEQFADPVRKQIGKQRLKITR